MENLEMIVKGVNEETALQVKNSLSEFIVKANEWREQIDSLVIESVNDTAKMKIAREARLFLKNNRLEAKRLTDMKRDEVKAKKLQFDLEDKTWLKGFQLVEEVCKSLEDKAKEKEEYAERVEAERKEKLRQDRWQQLGEYVEDEPYGLGDMPESTFNAFLTGARQQHEERLEAQRKAEEERIKKEEEERKEQERIRIENEQLKKQAEEAEKRRKALEEERLKLQREKEAELARIQAELEMERKREELRIQREKEAEEVKKKAEREALLAPDKDKIISFIKSVNPQVPDLSSTSSREVLSEVIIKLDGWRKWAEKTVNEKL
jgi:hypothetical protein